MSLDKLEALLRQGTDDISEATPLIAALFGIDAGVRYPAQDLTPQQQRARTLAVLVEQLLGLARCQPVLMVLEDTHWIDPTTLELLGQVLDRIAGVRVLMLLTSRPDNQPILGGHPHVTRLTLNRLGHGPTQAIVEHLTGSRGLPPGVLGEIAVRTDGVPLFVEEVTKAVLEAGTAGSGTAVPASLHASLMARLDRVPGVKEVAQVAACIGREFDYPILAAISPLPEAELRTALDRLAAAELVFRRGTPPEASYAFKHALVRDAAHESLLKAQRQHLHSRIARALEERFPETAEIQPELVAHHLTEARLMEEAVAYWYSAGQRAGERSAHVEAVTHLSRGLELLRHLPETLERIREEIRLQMALGLSLIAIKGYAAEEVGAAYARARGLCEQIGEHQQLFTALWGLWAFNQFRMRLTAAHDLAGELLHRAQQQGDLALLLEAHHAGWTTCLHRGDLQACVDHAEQGIALYEREKHHAHAFQYGGHDLGACCRRMGADALWMLGYPDRALAQARDGLVLARELGHPLTLAHALFSLSLIHQYRRELQPAQEYAEATTAYYMEQGIGPQLAAFGVIIRGWSMVMRGEASTGVAELRRGLDGMRATRTRIKWSYFLALFGEACHRAGQTEEGLAAVADAQRFVEVAGERMWETEVRRLKGELLLGHSASDYAEAEADFREAAELARQRDARSSELRAAMSLACLWRDLGRRVEARELLAPICGWFTEGFDTPDLKEARALLEELCE